MALAWAFGADDMILMTLAPKSVTSPIAMLVAEQIGGVVALAAVFVMITGVLGAIFGPELLRRFGVQHPAARGIALGLTAHRSEEHTSELPSLMRTTYAVLCLKKKNKNQRDE